MTDGAPMPVVGTPLKQTAVAKPRRGMARRLTMAAGSFVMMTIILLLAGFVLLSAGPLRVPLLGERVALALEGRIGSGIDVTIGETTIEKTSAGLELHAYDVRFHDAAGKEIISAPEALIAFEPLALARLSIEPRSVRLRGVTVRAEIRPDGDVRLSTADGRKAGGRQETQIAAPEPILLQDALAFLVGIAQTGRISGLDALAVTDARLIIDDQRVGRELNFEAASAVFATPDAGRAILTGSVSRSGAVTPYRLEALRQDDGARLNLSLNNLPLRLAETLGGNTALAAGGDSTVAVHATLMVGPDGRAKSGGAEVRLTPGSVIIPALFEGPWRVDDAKIETAWTREMPGQAQFKASFAGAGGTGAMSGAVIFEPETHLPHRLDGRIEALSLTPLSPKDKPVVVTEGSIALRFLSIERRVIMESLLLKGPDTDLQLSGEARQDPAGPAAKLSLAATRMPVRTALRWWPTGVANGGRNWLIGAVDGGSLRSLNITLDLPPAELSALVRQEALGQQAFRLDVAVEDGVARVMEGVPAISGLSGGGWIDSHRGELQATRGIMDLPGAGRRIQLSEGSVQLNRLDTWTPDIAIGFRTVASAEHAAEVLRAPQFKDVFLLDINPQDIRGQVDGRARVALPLGKPLARGDVKSEVKASIRGMSLEKAIGTERLENANLTISADATGIEVKGDGRWRNMPVQVTLENDSQDRSTATTLSFLLDEAQQRRMGIASQVTGPLPVKIRASREQGEGLRAQVEVDLTRAAIDGLLPGLQKPAGRAGKLTFDAIERAKAYQLQNIALDSGASSFRGSAEVGADGALSSARFSLFRLSPGDNVRLEFDRTPAGGRATIRGNNLDARPFLKAATQDGPTSPRGEKDMDLDLKTTLLSGHNGEVLTNAEVRLQRRSGQTRQIAISGRLNGKPLTISGQAADRPAPMTVDADDAGAFLRFTDIYTRMQGGDLVAQIRPTPRDLSGFLITRNFTLRNEPALRRLLNEGQADGSARNAEAAGFTKMRIDFIRSGTTTTIRDALIFGPQLGVTFNGVVDFVRDRISLSGTFIPAYGLNNAFASIPVLGNILGGGRNEGLLGITFGVSGRASQPEVSVNPLSAVAPGIFRRIFEFRNDRSNFGVTPPTPSPGAAN